MHAVRLTAVALLTIGLSVAAQGKDQFSEWVVVKIVNFKGEVTFESIGVKIKQEDTNRNRTDRNYRRPTVKKITPIRDLNNKLLAEYNKAAKAYNRKAAVWTRNKANANKTMPDPRPVKPSVTTLRSRITDGNVAKKVAENTTIVWKKNIEIHAAAKAKRAKEEAKRRENYKKYREAAIQKAAENKAIDDAARKK